MIKGIMIEEYLSRDIEKTTEQILLFLMKNNYSLDYRPSYNVITHGEIFINFGLCPDDFIFMCNKYSKIVKKLKDKMNYADDDRLSINHISKEYQLAKEKGCCGFYDEVFHNFKTGNTIYYGFNYGH